MGARYSIALKEAAMQLWLSGRTDAEIGKTLGVRRADTIRDWRHAGRWEHLKDLIRRRVDEQIAALRIDKVRALNERHDNIGAAIEQQAVRQLQALSASGDLTPADLRAISAAMLNAQRLRRTALNADDQPAATPPEQAPPIIVFNEARPPRRAMRVVGDQPDRSAEPGAA